MRLLLPPLLDTAKILAIVGLVIGLVLLGLRL
jgi:hypothetical protein